LTRLCKRGKGVTKRGKKGFFRRLVKPLKLGASARTVTLFPGEGGQPLSWPRERKVRVKKEKWCARRRHGNEQDLSHRRHEKTQKWIAVCEGGKGKLMK